MPPKPRSHRSSRALFTVALLAASGCGDAMAPDALDEASVEAPLDHGTRGRTYSNPISIRIPGTDRIVESCPDPSIIRGQTPGDRSWYLYCTSNPLHAGDVDAAGNDVFHLITMHRSEDLVHWRYVGDAFSQQPPWADAPQGFWAPDIQYFDGKYHLYYSASETKPGEPGDAVIGAASSGVLSS